MSRNAPPSVSLLVFGLTLFLSAALMFGVQPMVGKMLLPLVGGTPAGWVVAMAFFQIALLLGYFLAHGLSRLSPRMHGIFYIAALIVAAVMLPVDVRHHVGRIAENPGARDVFLLLIWSVAAPFIALSATSSTMQRLFTTTSHASAKDPYFLYAASNFGSFAGLLSYPILIEPFFTLSGQAHFFSAAYATLILVSMGCLLLSVSHPADKKEAVAAPPSLGARRYLEWMALAFVPSSLLLGITTYITTDVISVPMIWVLPLACYLLTFIIAFSRKPVVSLALMDKLHPWTVLIAILLICVMKIRWLGGWSGILIYLSIFFVVALICHMRLASLRPLDKHRQHLTGFYLMISVGGALGGIVNAFIVPNVFDQLIELPLILLASLLLHPAMSLKHRHVKIFAGALVAALLFANVSPPDWGVSDKNMRYLMTYTVFMLLGVSLVYKNLVRPDRLMMAILVLFLFAQFAVPGDANLLRIRNFYGTIKVYDRTAKIGNNDVGFRFMNHGTTVHGMQILDRKYETMPTTYYTKSGPLGDVFSVLHPRNVGVIGLGSGALSCYATPKRAYTFFELDPDIVKVAQTRFTMLEKCATIKKPHIIVGDGRLEIERLQKEKFDMIILDAFSSDSIPTHLLTQEAFSLYQQRLAKNGVMLLNISNRFFALWDMIAATTKPLGYSLVVRRDINPTEKAYATPSMWAVLTKSPVTAKSFEKKGWLVVPSRNGQPVWTDDYTNLLSTLSLNVGTEKIIP